MRAIHRIAAGDRELTKWVDAIKAGFVLLPDSLYFRKTKIMREEMRWRLLVIDDHPLFLEGVAAILRKQQFIAHVVTATDAHAGLALAEREMPDLVLLDLNLPGLDGFSAIIEFRRRFPALPVVVISAMERDIDVRRAIDAGAMGYILKSSSPRALVEAVQQVLREGTVCVPTTAQAGGVSHVAERAAASSSAPTVEELSLRQMEVLACVCQGLSNKQIASELGLSEKTVKAHVTAVFRALGVVSRTQAILAARKHGMMGR